MPEIDLNDPTTRTLVSLVTILSVFGALQGICAMLIFAERKISAWAQNRIGPNRVGPWGLLQSLADGMKFILKEDIIPDHVNKFLFLLAPCVALTTAMLAFAVVPFGQVVPPPPLAIKGIDAGVLTNEVTLKDVQKTQAHQRLMKEKYDQLVPDYPSTYQATIAPNLDIGILFVFAVSSLAVYGIILGGWSANNKYSMLGGLRSSAQIISYEIPLGLSILGVVLMSGSLNLEQIIWSQAAYANDGGSAYWFICTQPLAFLLFMISAFAETNRLPFDLPEAEQELIGGYHTEYSAMKFAMFFLAEYTHMVTTSFLMVTLFLGGWHCPWIAEADSHWALKFGVFFVKMSMFIVWYMLIRWTIPRFRYDQLMTLAWKVLIPLAIANLVAVMIVLELKRITGIAWITWLLLPISLAILISAGLFGTAPTKRVVIKT